MNYFFIVYHAYMFIAFIVLCRMILLIEDLWDLCILGSCLYELQNNILPSCPTDHLTKKNKRCDALRLTKCRDDVFLNYSKLPIAYALTIDCSLYIALSHSIASSQIIAGYWGCRLIAWKPATSFCSVVARRNIVDFDRAVWFVGCNDSANTALQTPITRLSWSSNPSFLRIE